MDDVIATVDLLIQDGEFRYGHRNGSNLAVGNQ